MHSVPRASLPLPSEHPFADGSRWFSQPGTQEGSWLGERPGQCGEGAEHARDALSSGPRSAASGQQHGPGGSLETHMLGVGPEGDWIHT